MKILKSLGKTFLTLIGAILVIFGGLCGVLQLIGIGNDGAFNIQAMLFLTIIPLVLGGAMLFVGLKVLKTPKKEELPKETVEDQIMYRDETGKDIAIDMFKHSASTGVQTADADKSFTGGCFTPNKEVLRRHMVSNAFSKFLYLLIIVVIITVAIILRGRADGAEIADINIPFVASTMILVPAVIGAFWGMIEVLLKHRVSVVLEDDKCTFKRGKKIIGEAAYDEIQVFEKRNNTVWGTIHLAPQYRFYVSKKKVETAADLLRAKQFAVFDYTVEELSKITAEIGIRKGSELSEIETGLNYWYIPF